jgi:hypothetical protein
MLERLGLRRTDKGAAMAQDFQRSAEITVELTRTEAVALIKVGETGLAVIEALGLIVNTSAMKAALDKVQGPLR